MKFLVAVVVLFATVAFARVDHCSSLTSCLDCTTANPDYTCNWCFTWSGPNYCYDVWNSSTWCHGSARGYLGTCTNVSLAVAIGVPCGVVGLCVIVCIVVACCMCNRRATTRYQQIPAPTPSTTITIAQQQPYQVAPQPYQAPPAPFAAAYQPQQPAYYAAPQTVPGSLYPAVQQQ